MWQVFSHLSEYYKRYKCPDCSFIKQLRDSTNFIGFNVENVGLKECLAALDNVFLAKISYQDKDELFPKIINLCDRFDQIDLFCVSWYGGDGSVIMVIEWSRGILKKIQGCLEVTLM